MHWLYSDGGRMGRMVDSEGGVHFERQGLLPPSSLIRVKATALLCSLNKLALPAQDEPTCICGRGCLPYPTSRVAALFLPHL